MSEERKSRPMHKSIMQYWKSREASERLDQYRFDHRLELEFVDMLKKDDCFFCFGCYEQEESWRSFDRAHIVPAMLGGSNHPSNFVMLCSECHYDNPNTVHEEIYFKWLDGVEFCYSKKYRRLLKALKLFEVSFESIDRIYDEKGEDFFLEMACNVVEECGIHSGTINYSSFAGALSVHVQKWAKENPINRQMELFK